MQVLHVFKTYYPETFGGIERTIHGIASGAVANGIGNTVFCLNNAPSPAGFEFGGYRVVSAKRDIELLSTGISLRGFPVFRQLVAAHDIVHYHFPWPFMDAMHLAGRTRKPSLVTYHSDIVRQKASLNVYNPLMHRFLSSMDAIVATSPPYLETSPVLARYRAKTEVIPFGIKDGMATDEGLNETEFTRPYFMFVGVHRYYKGIHHLIEAAKDAQADIVICGEGPETPDLRKRAAGQSNVHIIGAVNEERKNALLRGALGFVMPSHLRSEAFGIALLEAAMMGVPMISCEIGTGTTFVNVDGETGLTVPPANPAALAAAMNRLVGDQNLARTYARGARARYNALFTWERMVAGYVELYRRLGDAPSSQGGQDG